MAIDNSMPMLHTARPAAASAAAARSAQYETPSNTTVAAHLKQQQQHQQQQQQQQKTPFASRLHEYNVVREIGKGCFSTVYFAIHVQTQREIALKVIKKDGANMDAVWNEVRSHHRLRGHPNIVQLYDVFEDTRNVYMALEYCERGNLHDYLVAYGRLSEQHARLWFRQLLSAVQFCEQNGVVSRDIKNSNVVIDGHGNVKLADFGLAVLVENVETDLIKHSAGSAVFAAPEVYSARRAPYQVVPAEMWALGAILHSMIKRVLPFPHIDYAKHWHRYNVPTDVSKSLQDLLACLLTFEPSKRPTLAQVQSHPWVLDLDFGMLNISTDSFSFAVNTESSTFEAANIVPRTVSSTSTSTIAENATHIRVLPPQAAEPSRAAARRHSLSAINHSYQTSIVRAA